MSLGLSGVWFNPLKTTGLLPLIITICIGTLSRTDTVLEVGVNGLNTTNPLQLGIERLNEPYVG